jgi:serine/threonine protein kinase
VLEYAKDGNLQEYVQRKGGKLAIYETMEVVRQVGMALHALHQDNVTHRDIKPANIVKNGDNFIIIDFGIAKDESGQQTQISSIMAKTVGYSPPEQVDKSVVKQPSMDIYALGATAYMMLTGQVPTPAEVRQSRLFADGVDDLAEPKALNSSVPDNINTAIMKAMALNRQARYQSIPEMFADLNLPTDMMAPPRNAPVETLILDKSGTPISTPNPQISSDSTSVFQEVTPTKKPEKRKNRTALWLTIATCLLLGVGIAFWQPWVMPTKNEETKKEKKGLSEEDAKEANRKALEDIITDEKTIDKENEKSKDEKSNTTPPSIKGYEDTKIDKTNPPQPQPPIKREEIKPIDKPSGNQGVLSSFTASYQKKNKVQVTFCTPASMSGFTFSIHGAAITSQKQEQIINASACAYPNKFLLEYNANFRKGDNCQVQVYHQNRLIGTVLFIHNP